MRLYHTGYQEIRQPDVHYGRKNADFGQGFYLTANEDFASRWARERKGEQTFVNSYELDLTGLQVHRFERDADWFSYIFANRRAMEDRYAEADVIIGPIANDTIFETFGILTSGYLKDEEALKLLQIDPCYEQVVLKTQKAADHLTWLSSRIISGEEIASVRESVVREQEAYQAAFAEVMQGFA